MCLVESQDRCLVETCAVLRARPCALIRANTKVAAFGRHHRGGWPSAASSQVSFVLALNIAHVLALNTAQVLPLNKADVLALNKAHVLRLNTKIRGRGPQNRAVRGTAQTK